MNYDTRYYIQIYNLVLSKKLCKHKRYSELFKYQDVLYKLFLLNNDRDIKKNYMYIPYCLEIVKKMPDHLDYLDEDLLKFISINGRATPIYYTDLLRLIFFPESINTIGEYLTLMSSLFDDHRGDLNEYKFKYPKFANLYEYYLNNIGRCIDNRCMYTIDQDIMITILAYIYRNNIDSFEMVDRYLDNRDYYREKFTLNGIYLSKGFNRRNYYNLQYEKFYNGINNIFNSQKRLIK